ncbi:MAG: FkbM family methyltransferase [Cyanophyceae cyanobacterium]
MTSVIIFSKDRPLQLCAYIESLIHYSGIAAHKINVLFCKSETIPYQVLEHQFPDIHWIPESDFYQDLLEIIARCDDHILWGCDDVCFKSKFKFEVCETALNCNEQILAFSLRLGKNIAPLPLLTDQQDYLTWDWTTCDLKETPWTYPWEVSASVYRKNDIQQLLQISDQLKHPNYLEGLLAHHFFGAPQGKQWRRQLACFPTSKTITIQVNRVQDVCPNEFDNSARTDVEKLYQDFMAGYRLDWKSFSNCLNQSTHVESEYFKLHKPGTGGIKPSTESYETCLESSHSALKQGRIQEGIRWCQDAVMVQPINQKAYAHLGNIYEHLGRQDCAERCRKKSAISFVDFLGSESVRSVVHVGAHHGQEIYQYQSLSPNLIVWVEADPKCFEILEKTVAESEVEGTRNVCVNALVTDSDDEVCSFFVFSNDGASSSIYHSTNTLRDTFSDVHETGETLQLKTARLDTILKGVGLPLGGLDVLVVDVQGAEMLCLVGAGDYLDSVKFLEVEVSQEALYEHGALFKEVDNWLINCGFIRVSDVPWHGNCIYQNPSRCQSQLLLSSTAH